MSLFFRCAGGRLNRAAAFAVLALASLGFGIPRASAECVDYSGTFHYLGSADLPSTGRNLIVEGDYAYVVSANGYGSDLRIFDVSTVGQPYGAAVPLGTVSFPGNAVELFPLGIAVAGGRAYVTTGMWGGLAVIDVSNPAAPSVTNTIPIANNAIGVAVSAGYAYVATTTGGVMVFDLSDPDHPTLAGDWGSISGDVIVIENGYAYLTSYYTGPIPLTIVDISNPTQPVQVGTLTGIRGGALGVANGYAYVGGGSYGIESYGQFSVVDVQDPAHPVLASSVRVDLPVVGIAVRGPAAYATGATEMGGGGFMLVSVSDPAHPEVVRFDYLGGPGKGVCIRDREFFYVYNAAQGGLKFGRTADNLAPLQLGSLPAQERMVAAAVAGNMAYALDWAGYLCVVDLLDPHYPHQRGTVPLNGGPMSVDLVGSYAYVGQQIEPLEAVDVSDPDHPLVVATVPGLDGVFKVLAQGNLLYLARSGHGLSIVDVTQPSAPVLLSTLPGFYNAYDVTVLGHYAYVADVQSLRVVDVQDPNSPTLVGNLAVEARAVTGLPGVLYVISNHGQIKVVDISDPVHPVVSGTAYSSTGQGLWVHDGYLYLAGTADLDVLDLSDPLRPYLIGEATGAGGQAVTTTARLVIVAARALVVCPLECGVPQAVHLPSCVAGDLSLEVVPNPTRGASRITFSTVKPVTARLLILDPLGREVTRLADEWMPAGLHVLAWDGRDKAGHKSAAGNYWVRVDTGTEKSTQRIVLVPGGE